MKDFKELNCPNCGAPITGERCEYCGTVFYDWAVIDSNKPFYIKFRLQNKILMCKANMESFSAHITSDSPPVYADNQILYMPQEEITIEPIFRVVPENGILYAIKAEEPWKGE